MNKINRTHWTVLTIALALVLLIGFGFKTHFDSKTETYLAIANDNLRTQEQTINKLQNGLKTGGDSFQGTISVADCSREDRLRFDELLSKLADLNRAELAELDSSYNSCAYYYSTIQTIGASQLDREVQRYTDMLRALAVFDTTAEKKLAKLDKWDEIVLLTGQRSALHVDLVNLQHDIVVELLAYKQIQHPDVQSLVSEGNEIRENLIFLTQQIDQLRTEINTP